MVFFVTSAVCRQYVIIIIANFSIAILSMEIAWISPALVKLRDVNETTLSRPITDGEGAWIASASAVVALPVILVSGFLTDRLGRKSCIVLAAIPRLVMSLIFIFATEVWMLYLAKGLCGLSDALVLSAVPTYVSEIASKEIRGALGTITQVLSALGMLVMLSIGPFVSYLTMNIICSAVVFLLFVVQLFLPESPYFLYVQGRKEDSLKVLTSIRNSAESVTEETKEYSINIVSFDKTELLKDKTVLKTIGKVIFLSIGFQVIGYNSVAVYLQTIFESTNTSLKSEVASVVIGCIQLLACGGTIFLTDRFGRKPIGTDSDFNWHGGWAGIGSILWMLIAELFDGPTRAIGVSCGVFFTTLSLFLTLNYFSFIVNTIGPAATYWIFGGNCIVMSLFILVFIPETKGRTFSEIQRALGRKLKEDILENSKFKGEQTVRLLTIADE